MPKNAKQRLRKKYERAEKFGRALCAVAGLEVRSGTGCVELIKVLPPIPAAPAIYKARVIVLKRPITEDAWRRAVERFFNA